MRGKAKNTAARLPNAHPRDMYLMSACFPLLMLFVYGPAFVCPSTRERAVLVISYLACLREGVWGV